VEAFPLTAMLARLDAEGSEFLRLLRTADFDLNLYKPDGVDRQAPHKRAEAYIVASGTGVFMCDGTTRSVAPGDLLFVPAGVEHRFVDFTDDFSTWVIFFGAPPA
jgi:mannose-6-phosphate isomerase-like protein (cupin superfamily)